MEPIERLESAIERAESTTPQTPTVAQTLCEIFRIARVGFTDSEADYWSERLESLLS